MSNKSQPNSPSQKILSQTPSLQPSILLSPGFQVKENHLSSNFQNLLKYEEQNFEIEYLTKTTSIPKNVIQSEMKNPLIPSALKGEQIFQKYGSLIQNQPIFLKELIFHDYLPYLPQKFQNEFSQIMMVGSGFEVVWWGSLVISLIQAYRHRNADVSLREKGTKMLAYGFGFVASSLGFHEHYYIPKLKNCYFNNIKVVDSLMDRHISILKSCGVTFQERTFDKPSENIKLEAERPIQAPNAPQKSKQTSKKADLLATNDQQKK